MAGRYAPLHSSIWTNPRFVALEPRAQLTYLLIISQPDISYAGVVSLTPGRWARMSANTSTAEIERAIGLLTHARFVFVDVATEELMVRTFVEHNQILKQKQLHKALKRAYDSILSTRLRCLFYDEQTGEVKALLGSPPEASSSAMPEPIAPVLPDGSGLKDLDLDLDLHRDQQRQPEPAEPEVEDETARRVDARRRRGEDIGPGLIALIRADVIRDLTLREEAGDFEDSGPARCAHCTGSFVPGAGWMHYQDCPSLEPAPA